MSYRRYPSNLVITKEDFKDCRWQEAIANIEQKDYSAMWQAFSSAANKAMEEDRLTHSKILWLLADACSMMLNPESLNEPFKPVWVMSGKRSTIPDDLPDADIAFLAEIVAEVSDAWLKARLADLVWLKQRPRNVEFARAAIDAYKSIPLDSETWVRGGRECWDRAIKLATILKAGAENRLSEMETHILNSLTSTTSEHGLLCCWLADLLLRNRLGRAHGEQIAQKLETIGDEFEDKGELRIAREYYLCTQQWFKFGEKTEKVTELTVDIAESWAKEATERISSDTPSHLVAADFYEKAIQKYREIPRSERAPYNVDERLAELHAQLQVSGQKAVDEMGVIRTAEIDISDDIESARNVVRGKSVVEALFTFANLYQGSSYQKLRQDVTQRLQASPLHTLLSSTLMSRDGRVIAKRPGLNLGEDDVSDDEILIRSEMIRDHGILVAFVVQAHIWPALESLLLEHRLTNADFIGLANESPIVPPGREQLFGKALFAGYDRDFITALHLLVPQIEHLVRYRFKLAGVKTTTMSSEGIENENGLSTLMEHPQVNDILGEDLAFEIRSLFCDVFGPNLRNEVAHGLLDHEECQSVYAIYAWWFGLKLVFNTFWHVKQRNADENPSDAAEATT